MSDSFNPYEAWLGIHSDGRPDHYALLGLPRFESDPQRVALAADDRVAQLRKVATKDRLNLAKGLAQQILAARNCLLSATDRAAYDALLESPLAGGPMTARLSIALPPRAFDDNDDEPETDAAPLEGIALPPEPALPPAVLVATPPGIGSATAEVPPIAKPAVVLRAARDVVLRRPGARLPLILGGALIGVLGACLAVFAPQWLRGTTPRAAVHESNPSPIAQRDASPDVVTSVVVDAMIDDSPTPANQDLTMESSDDAPMVPAVDTPLQESPAEVAAHEALTTAIEAPPAEGMPMAATPPAENASELQATLATLAAARKAMGNGDLDAAADQLDLADLEAHDTDTAELVGHDRAVLEYLKGFWRAVDEGFKQLSAGLEFEWEGRTVVVVERTPERLIVRAAGRNRTYERQRLPPNLAVLLANRWMKQDDANTPLFLAAFHLLDADGDRDEARRLLEGARSAGTEGVDALVRELDGQATE